MGKKKKYKIVEIQLNCSVKCFSPFLIPIRLNRNDGIFISLVDSLTVLRLNGRMKPLQANAEITAVLIV